MRRPTFDLAGGRRVLEKLHQLVLEYDFALPGGKVLADSKSVRVGYCDRELSAALGFEIFHRHPGHGAGILHQLSGGRCDWPWWGYASISAERGVGRWRFVVPLRSVIIGSAKRSPEKAGARLGLVVVIVARLVPAETRLSVTGAGARRARNLKLAARSDPGQHNLRILQAILRHQRIKRGGILGRDAHAAMRDGFAEILHLIAAVDGVTVLYKENRMWHGGVIPLLAIPNFIHRSGSISP